METSAVETNSRCESPISPAARHLLRWVNEGLNRLPDADSLSGFLRPQLTLHLPCRRPDVTGIEGALAFFEDFHRTWGGAHTNVEELIDGGSKVAVRLRTQARHQGEFLLAPASNRSVEFTQTLVAHADASGALVEVWVFNDSMGLAMLVDAIPPLTAHSPGKALYWAARTGLRRLRVRKRARRLALEPPSGRDADTPELVGPLAVTNGQRLGRALVDQVFGTWINERQLHRVTANLAPTAALHVPPSVEPCPLVGPSAWNALISGLVHGFPDLVLTIEDTVANGDLVLARIRLVGTHLGIYRGLPATGHPFTFYETLTFRIGEGPVVLEGWQEIDAISLLMQVGMYPGHGLGPLGIVRWFGGTAKAIIGTAIQSGRS